MRWLLEFESLHPKACHKYWEVHLPSSIGGNTPIDKAEQYLERWQLSLGQRLLAIWSPCARNLQERSFGRIPDGDGGVSELMRESADR